MTDYSLYHDESTEGGYWHGMLLIPTSKKELIVGLLERARKNTGYKSPIGIKKVKRRGKIFRTAYSWVQIGVGFLRSNSKLRRYPVYLGEIDRKHYIYSDLDHYCTGAKFILFREVKTHNDLTGYPDHTSKIETSFRMGLKGGLHFLGNEDNPIRIVSMHFDGYEHHKRHIDKERIIKRLTGLRDYCEIDFEDIKLDDRTSNHDRKNSQEYGDCQLLQLTDLFIGCFRTAFCFGTRDIHRELAKPVKVIIKKYMEGYARMKNSRWFDSFCMSQCYLDEGFWEFETISYDKPKPIPMDLP